MASCVWPCEWSCALWLWSCVGSVQPGSVQASSVACAWSCALCEWSACVGSVQVGSAGRAAGASSSLCAWSWLACECSSFSCLESCACRCDGSVQAGSSHAAPLRRRDGDLVLVDGADARRALVAGDTQHLMQRRVAKFALLYYRGRVQRFHDLANRSICFSETRSFLLSRSTSAHSTCSTSRSTTDLWREWSKRAIRNGLGSSSTGAAKSGRWAIDAVSA